MALQLQEVYSGLRRQLNPGGRAVNVMRPHQVIITRVHSAANEFPSGFCKYARALAANCSLLCRDGVLGHSNRSHVRGSLSFERGHGPMNGHLQVAYPFFAAALDEWAKHQPEAAVTAIPSRVLCKMRMTNALPCARAQVFASAMEAAGFLNVRITTADYRVTIDKKRFVCLRAAPTLSPCDTPLYAPASACAGTSIGTGARPDHPRRHRRHQRCLALRDAVGVDAFGFGAPSWEAL